MDKEHGREGAHKQKFVRSFAVLGLSSVLNRGGPLLIFPLLTASLSVIELGLYTVAIVIVAIMAPIIGVNGQAAVLREGTESYADGYFLFIKYSFLPTVVLCAISISAIINPDLISDWRFWLAVTVPQQAIHDLFLALRRSQSKDWSVFAISGYRFLATGLSAYFTMTLEAGLLGFMVLNASSHLFLSITFVIQSIVHGPEKTRELSLWPYLAYTAPLILHSISQWVLSSSGRLIVLFILGESAAGYYGIGSMMASPMSLFLTTLTLVLPTHIIKNIHNWRDAAYRVKAVWMISALVVICQLAGMALVIIDYSSFKLLKHYSPELVAITGLMSAGFGVLCYYAIYGNILFFHRRTKLLALCTALVGIVNLGFSLILVNILDSIGVALASFLSYMCFLTLVAFFTFKVDREMKPSKDELLIIIATLSINIILVVGASYFWQQNFI